MLRRHCPTRLAQRFHPQAAELRARVFRRLDLKSAVVFISKAMSRLAP